MSGRVALVTGGNRGIGRALSIGLAREGAAVVVNNLRPDGSAQEVVREICAAGGKALAHPADLRNLHEHSPLVEAAVERFGRLDILINNAGVEFREPFLKTRPETFEQTLVVNLRAPYFLSQRAAEAMIACGGGSIIHLSSVHDHHPLRNRSAYAASKGGLAMLTKAMAFELAEYGIRVNSISPGAILTDMNRESLSVPENLNRCLGKIAVKRLGEVEDVVGAAVFLASAESGYVTGTTIYIDGGMLLF